MMEYVKISEVPSSVIVDQVFTGTNCTIYIIECYSFPCLHGSTCYDLDNDCRCDCADGFEEETHARSIGFVKTKRMITPAHVRKDIQARIVRSMWTSAGQLMVQALAGMGKPVEMILDTTRANVFLDTMVPLSV